MQPGEPTGLRDRNGVSILIGSRLRFFYRDGCVWDGTVEYDDGLTTVSILDAAQVTNPAGWAQPHEWVKSRNWACMVGYGEYGTWNCPRRPLVEIAEGWADYAELKPLYEAHGHLKGRILKTEVIAHPTTAAPAPQPQGV